MALSNRAIFVKPTTLPAMPFTLPHPDFTAEKTVFSQHMQVPFSKKHAISVASQQKDKQAALRTTAGIEPFAGDFNEKKAAHLLRRTLFGPTRNQITQAASLGVNATLDLLLAPQDLPPPPVNWYYQEDNRVPIGQTWVNVDFVDNGEIINYQRASLYSWSLGHYWKESFSLREKMSMFWFNHFVTQFEVVQEPRIMYRYMELMLTHALGNFKDLTKVVTLSPAMLVYLNGNGNNKEAPNENYARELFELFTIGKGPLVGQGNYTHFTEQDVQAAARVLTGWYVDLNPVVPVFAPQIHDTGNKQFSEAFDGQVITNNGNQEYGDLIEMIFGKKETARFICRKLYRWFVYYAIDATIEESIIEPLASTLVAHDFDIVPVLRQLFSSAHFYSAEAEGALIKNPLDFSLSVVNSLEMDLLPTGTPAQDFAATIYNNYLWFELYRELENQQQAIMNPPSVAGWPAYYQEPVFHQIWINSVTLPLRNNFFKILLRPQGIMLDDFRFRLEPLKVVATLSEPYEPTVLINELAALLLPQGITDAQKAYLKEALIPGLPDFEWTVEYLDHVNDPENQQKRMAVDNKLRTLFDALLSLAEFHLS